MKNEKSNYDKYPNVFNRDCSYNCNKLHLVSKDDLDQMVREGSIYRIDYEKSLLKEV